MMFRLDYLFSGKGLSLSKLVLIMFSLVVCNVANAESYIYLTNSTMEELSVSTVQGGHDNISHGDEWQQLADTVPPLATVKFLRFNRDDGIKWGKRYYFTTTVQGKSSTVELQQMLEGTWNFSKMWLSAENDPWQYDRDIHHIAQDFDGKASTLAYRSQYARVSGDDIYYVINNDFQLESREESNTNFKVLTYNVWNLLPGITAKNTHPRLDTIADYVKGYDAVVFEELFDPALTAHFRSKISAEYPYMTDIPFKLGKLLTGGSFIASRNPIPEDDDAAYDACRADGCLASKGMNYAKIDKGGKIYHLFGTHTHAYTTPDDVAVRFSQLQQLKDFVDGKQIPADEPVLMAGDFNVDKLNFPQEHVDFLNVMDATEPMALGEYPYSYAGPVNVYADDEYNEYLDYVLYSNQHQEPIYSHNKMLTPRSIEWDHWTTWDLSDHYPVASEFVFAE
jgi:endonuclease/exonuclease/phosphatase family metal-dependent hydrolase